MARYDLLTVIDFQCDIDGCTEDVQINDCDYENNKGEKVIFIKPHKCSADCGCNLVNLEDNTIAHGLLCEETH